MDIRCLGEATDALGGMRARPVRFERGPVGIGFGWVKARDKVEHILVHAHEGDLWHGRIAKLDARALVILRRAGKGGAGACLVRRRCVYSSLRRELERFRRSVL